MSASGHVHDGFIECVRNGCSTEHFAPPPAYAIARKPRRQPQYPTEADLAPKSDPVNHPRHYTMGGIEVLDFILAWDLSFMPACVVKYVVRAPYKGTQLEDLKKAQFYLNKMIERVEKETKK